MLVRLGPAWYPGALFSKSTEKKHLYLTFDDGPTPEITSEVLDILHRFDAKATFFLIGENTKKHPELATRMKTLGHSLGGHCMNHENGMKTKNDDYLASAISSMQLLETDLFRPPYGRIRKSQYHALKKQGVRTVFWDVLSYDFDTGLSAEHCFEMTYGRVKPGSIVVFHDSIKAAPRMLTCLPKLLQAWKEDGFEFVALS